MQTSERSGRLAPPSLAAFRRLAVATLAAALALVALGGAVRATDSGLACPDWPRCYGLWIPPGDPNIWVEHSHRLLAGVVALMIAGLLAWALAVHRERRDLLWLTGAAAVLVSVQAGLGALVVLRLLRAELVTAHLGLAMIVLAVLVVLATGGLPTRDRGAAARRPLAAGGNAPGRRLARTGAAVAALCYAQVLVGGHVTGINAGLVYTDFPLMGGALLPTVTSQREAYHVAHRLLAFVLAGGVAWLCAVALRYRAACRARGRWDGAQRWLVRLPLLAGGLVVVQIGLGVANLWTATSPLTVIPHLAVASWLWTILVLHTVLAHRHAAGGPDATAPAAVRRRRAVA